MGAFVYTLGENSLKASKINLAICQVMSMVSSILFIYGTSGLGTADGMLYKVNPL